MSPRVGTEAESGNAVVARDTDREETRPRLTVWPSTNPQTKTPTPVERIGKLTAAELAELSPPDERGVQSGAFSKRFGQEKLDWSALRNPTPIPPPPAAEPISVPSAVQAFYGKLPEASERAELHIADLSLELANPFVGSSLNPPPAPKRPWLKPLLISLGGCVLIGAGYVGAVYQVDRHAASTVAKWTGAEVAPAIAVVPEAQPQAAMTAQVAPPRVAQKAAPAPTEQPVPEVTGEAAHIATNAIEEEAVAITESDPNVAVAVTEQSEAATPATESTAAATSPRTRRRAARAVAAPEQESAKAVEAKPETAPVAAPIAAPAAPAAPTPARPELAPNPYVARPAQARPAAVRPAPVVAPVAQGPVPQTLSRAQVQSGLESMRGQLQTCAAGAHGRMTANVTISGAGRVTYATVDGAFAGTPQGSCMARALRGTQFPQFSAEQLRVVYPFAL